MTYLGMSDCLIFAVSTGDLPAGCHDSDPAGWGGLPRRGPGPGEAAPGLWGGDTRDASGPEAHLREPPDRRLGAEGGEDGTRDGGRGLGAFRAARGKEERMLLKVSALVAGGCQEGVGSTGRFAVRFLSRLSWGWP